MLGVVELLVAWLTMVEVHVFGVEHGREKYSVRPIGNWLICF